MTFRSKGAVNKCIRLASCRHKLFGYHVVQRVPSGLSFVQPTC